MEKMIVDWLLESNFCEAEKMFTASRNFYRTDTDLTAFFANVKKLDDSIGICFGLASTAFTRMAGSGDSLKKHGILNEDNCMRRYAFVRDLDDFAAFTAAFTEMWNQYTGTEKDALLQAVKDRRKAFLGRIHNVLKPYGFKRKGNEWRLTLLNHYILSFHADKSTYCDLYEFDIQIFVWTEKEGRQHRCVYQLYYPPLEHHYDEAPYRFDWQLNTENELMAALEDFLCKFVMPLLQGSMSELGKREYITKHCRCDRQCCANCWISPG